MWCKRTFHTDCAIITFNRKQCQNGFLGITLLLVGFYIGTQTETGESRLVDSKISNGYDSHQGKYQSVSPIQILYWTKPYDSFDVSKLQGSDPFKKCHYPFNQCTITYDHGALEESDIIVINFRLLKNIEKKPLQNLPPSRTSKQKWVMVSMEAPSNDPIPKALWNLFNVTFTYKQNSDIPTRRLPSLKALSVSKQKHRVSMYRPNGKHKKLVAWAVSRCPSCSQREDYVKLLQKYVDVDVYGECGDLKCKDENPRAHQSSDPCFAMINNTYLFYLAFENSLCEDYVTEKLYRTLHLDLVPVVYGGVNYSNILPPNSFINIEDYDSAEQLASYLQFLAENPKEYGKYLEWKSKYNSPTRRGPDYCGMCEYFHKTRFDPPRTVDLRSYWGVDTNCRDPKWTKRRHKNNRKDVLSMESVQLALNRGLLPYRCSLT